MKGLWLEKYQLKKLNYSEKLQYIYNSNSSLSQQKNDLLRILQSLNNKLESWIETYDLFSHWKVKENSSILNESKAYIKEDI